MVMLGVANLILSPALWRSTVNDALSSPAASSAEGVALHDGSTWPCSSTTGCAFKFEAMSTSCRTPPQRFRNWISGPRRRASQARRRVQRAAPGEWHSKCTTCCPYTMDASASLPAVSSSDTLTLAGPAQWMVEALGAPRPSCQLRQCSVRAEVSAPTPGRCPTRPPSRIRSASAVCTKAPAPLPRAAAAEGASDRVAISKPPLTTVPQCLMKETTTGRYGWYAGYGASSISTSATPGLIHSKLTFSALAALTLGGQVEAASSRPPRPKPPPTRTVSTSLLSRAECAKPQSPERRSCVSISTTACRRRFQNRGCEAS
mmetsp:Transcript_38171/g.101720  ORF Transcript_38171/g.101720 Transcript_38171/m.101720 type:complete len:317 (-) Transcript_38171:738-1688(-)